MRRCIRRENKKLFLLVTALLVYDFARRGFDFSQLPENPAWYYAWVVLALVSLMIDLLSRFGKTFANIS